ncbi:MAG: redox-sensitive bicupin YhaK (pirin superfamily) [Pseudoalteromonas distincta]|jgi:redox-sensitive bicupin YhaK (pirin superfamily)
MALAIDRIETAGPRNVLGPRHQNRLIIAPQTHAPYSPFLFLAEDWFAPPAGFPTHPHRGMETVTFVLEGQMLHEDHTGAHGELEAGDVQFMTAGGGVMHSEMPGPGGVHSLQLWLNLPAAQKMTPARYGDQRASDAARVTGEGYEARLYAGELGGSSRPHGSLWPLTLMDLRLDAGAALDLPLKAGWRGFLLVLEGEAEVGADLAALKADQHAWAHATGADDILPVKAQTPVRALFYAAPIIDEPVVAHGPFVMNTVDEIRQAFLDYQSGRLTSVRG